MNNGLFFFFSLKWSKRVIASIKYLESSSETYVRSSGYQDPTVKPTVAHSCLTSPSDQGRDGTAGPNHSLKCLVAVA